MNLEQASLIKALRGGEHKVIDTLGLFGMPRYRVDRVINQRVGKGRLPKRVLITTLNTMNARLPRTKEWHRVANRVVANMSQGMLARSTYETLARNIKFTVDTKKTIKKKPTLSTIEGWLKTHPLVNDQILNFRRSKKV